MKNKFRLGKTHPHVKPGKTINPSESLWWSLLIAYQREF